MKKVIEEHSGWRRMSNDINEEFKHWNTEDIVNWYYNNENVSDVQFININDCVIAYITIQEKPIPITRKC